MVTGSIHTPASAPTMPHGAIGVFKTSGKSFGVTEAGYGNPGAHGTTHLREGLPI
jgi:hypothetical protein